MPKISELPSVTSIAGNETIPLVQSTTTKKATISQLKGYRSFVGLITWDAINEEINLDTLQNDGFGITPNRTGTGEYTLEDSSGPFLESKTALFIEQNNNIDAPEYDVIMNTFYRYSDSLLYIKVKDLDLAGGNVYQTDNLRKVSFEIRVYP
ncbi:hypothetical protein UFOVP215_32 [uncultured Caudovirales phage]|uniref:Uncharacterized protein n=1 Tax=uncultured Caudovirales phage TaxID=2100421 RepID=A0A6J7WQ36_9CAUD|nr:hypothetical protein UFOVP215_32 [uncultured Caudovirales phage]